MAAKFLSCDGFGLSPAEIFTGILWPGHKLSKGFGFTDSEAIFTYQGRYGIYLITQLLNIGAGDEVLVPSYNCGAEVDPFVWAGAKVIFYRVDKKATIDTEDILRRVTPATKLIYVSHFFGWPQELSDLAKWCKERKLFLVEDCALCLFSKGPHNSIGCVGDAAIYSFVKTLPVPDGGALVLKNREIRNRTTFFRPPRCRNIFLNSLPLLKRWVMHKNRLLQRCAFAHYLINRSWKRRPFYKNQKIEREMPKSNYFDPQKINWSLSRLSKGIINKADPSKIVETRRRNYLHLYSFLRNTSSIKLLFDDLPDGVCPQSFPVIVENRNYWFNRLNSMGILVGGWPSYHRSFNWSAFPEARHLKNNVITLPIHQLLSPHHMDYIIECVNLIDRQNDNHNSR